MNFIDRLVGFIDPRAGAKRVAARVALDLAKRRYDAAGSGRRTANWPTTNAGPNTINEVDLDKLRGRSRSLVRNNGWAKSAVSTIASNVVGTGIQPAIKNKRVKAAWAEWAESKACDFYGLQNIYGLQRQAMEAVARDGEVIIRRRRKMSAGIPLRLQVQEADHIDTMRTYHNGDTTIIQGVEYNKDGERVAYWLYDNHPNDTLNYTMSRRVPASDVIHIYRPERPGQVRGVPWLAPVALRLRDFDEYADAEIMRQKIAAAFAAFVQDANPDAAERTEDGDELERIEPGMIEYLPPGKTVTFPNPPTTQNYDGFGRSILLSVAKGIGLSYEALTGDMKNVNFSSARMGWLEMQRNVEDWQYNLLVPQFCESVWSWFTEAGMIAGVVPKAGAIAVTWTPPRREMIDPTKEIPAMINGVRGGVISLQEVHRQSGYDSEQVLNEIADDNKRIDKLGLILDSDARKTMKAGVTQPYLDTPSNAATFNDPDPDPAQTSTAE